MPTISETVKAMQEELDAIWHNEHPGGVFYICQRKPEADKSPVGKGAATFMSLVLGRRTAWKDTGRHVSLDGTQGVGARLPLLHMRPCYKISKFPAEATEKFVTKAVQLGFTPSGIAHLLQRSGLHAAQHGKK